MDRNILNKTLNYIKMIVELEDLLEYRAAVIKAFDYKENAIKEKLLKEVQKSLK